MVIPALNTGHTQSRTQIKTKQAGRRYETIKIGSKGCVDIFDDYLLITVKQKLVELKPDRVIATHRNLEIRYVSPVNPASEHVSCRTGHDLTIIRLLAYCLIGGDHVRVQGPGN
jgi:hypothetical protein